MRSSYSGSVIGPKMSTCTLPRMFMPAPWITRTLGIALSVRTGMVGILPAVRVDSAASVAETRRWHTPDSDQEDHTHDHDRRVPGQGSRHARAHDHRRDGPALHQGPRRAEPVVHDGLAVRRTGGVRDRLSAGGQRVTPLRAPTINDFAKLGITLGGTPTIGERLRERAGESMAAVDE